MVLHKAATLCRVNPIKYDLAPVITYQALLSWRESGAKPFVPAGLVQRLSKAAERCASEDTPAFGGRQSSSAVLGQKGWLV